MNVSSEWQSCVRNTTYSYWRKRGSPTFSWLFASIEDKEEVVHSKGLFLPFKIKRKSCILMTFLKTKKQSSVLRTYSHRRTSLELYCHVMVLLKLRIIILEIYFTTVFLFYPENVLKKYCLQDKLTLSYHLGKWKMQYHKMLKNWGMAWSFQNLTRTLFTVKKKNLSQCSVEYICYFECTFHCLPENVLPHWKNG